MTNGRDDIKGTYSLNARITGRGDREHLLPSLKGDFELSARDGEFVRALAADATFDYLNGTGDLSLLSPTWTARRFLPARSVSGERLTARRFSARKLSSSHLGLIDRPGEDRLAA